MVCTFFAPSFDRERMKANILRHNRPPLRKDAEDFVVSERWRKALAGRLL
jgi:hypothetical protein